MRFVACLILSVAVVVISGCAAPTIYLKATNNGAVIYPMKDHAWRPGLVATWTGGKDAEGKAHGKGVLTAVENGRKTIHWVTFKHGLREGHSLEKFYRGGKLHKEVSGTCRGGAMVGTWTVKFIVPDSDGVTFIQGAFDQEGVAHGPCVVRYTDGTTERLTYRNGAVISQSRE